MHELSLIATAVEQAVAAAARAGAGSIERVHFDLIQGSHISPDTVETLFEALSRGTLAHGAAVAIHARNGRWQCLACAGPPAEWPTSNCPECGCPGQAADSRPELALTSIDTV